ncbi:hypothetical protein [Flavobacterium ajazii]|uniref:hypothetical protein n=1 Tax=Flavobacterium ajazii TaxID=2692318 RepID=UPI0013D06E6D|nr:hypothetical protein [Flavobacterium ajazii]
MKKILYLFLILCINCKSYQTEFIEYENHLPRHTVDKILKSFNAEKEQYSLLIFTQFFNGEEFIVQNDKRILLKESIHTIKNFGFAKTVRINNNYDVIAKDTDMHTKVLIKSSLAKKYKFIYIEKDKYLKDVVGNDSILNTKKAYKIIYSNTLLGSM